MRSEDQAGVFDIQLQHFLVTEEHFHGQIRPEGATIAFMRKNCGTLSPLKPVVEPTPDDAEVKSQQSSTSLLHVFDSSDPVDPRSTTWEQRATRSVAHPRHSRPGKPLLRLSVLQVIRWPRGRFHLLTSADDDPDDDGCEGDRHGRNDNEIQVSLHWSQHLHSIRRAQRLSYQWTKVHRQCADPTCIT